MVRTEPAHSAEESAELQGIEVGALLRSIVVRRGDDDYVFVLVPGGRRFDWPKLRAHLGVSRLSLPDADEARAATGYERGAITPFGAARAWPVIVDASAWLRADCRRRRRSRGNFTWRPPRSSTHSGRTSSTSPRRSRPAHRMTANSPMASSSRSDADAGRPSLRYIGATSLEIKAIALGAPSLGDGARRHVSRMLVVQFESFLPSNDERYQYRLPDR